LVSGAIAIGIAFVLVVRGKPDLAALTGFVMGLVSAGIAYLLTRGLLALPRAFGKSYRPGIWPFVIVFLLLLVAIRPMVRFVLVTNHAKAIAPEQNDGGYGLEGWTEEATGSNIIDPSEVAPRGTRVWRDTNGLVSFFYPLGVRPELPEPNFYALLLSKPLNGGDQACPDGMHGVDECWRDCPSGTTAAAEWSAECIDWAEPIVDRGLLGGCPTGYVDHPANPKQCVLPVVAEQVLRKAAGK